MKTIHPYMARVLLLGVLMLGLLACSESADRAAAGDEYQPEGLRQAVQNQDNNLSQSAPEQSSPYASGAQGQPEALPATVHRTVTFTGGSTALDDIAKQTLERVANALNGELATVVVVRTVDPNDVSAGEPDGRSRQRINAVEAFLQDQGVDIAEVRADKYSSREYHASQNSEDVQDTLEATSGLSELEQAEATDTSKQEVVITIVSSEPK